MSRERFAGVLAHITSLPSKYGIGDLGKECTGNFINFLQQINHTVWSILPLYSMGDDYCPYNARSTYAGSHEHICIDEVMDCQPMHDLVSDPTKVATVNYREASAFKKKMLWEAFQKTKGQLGPDYEEFKKTTDWLNDYTVFMAAGEIHGNNYDWSKWEPKGLRNHEADAIEKFKEDHAELVEFHCYIQYVFFQQLADLKKRVNDAGIKLLGDLPCYMNYQSADVWSNKEVFEIDPNTLKITLCSGVTADMFSADGQWWGHPVYRWKDNKAVVIDWWVKRLTEATKYFDMLRIDHALGLVSYCGMPWLENPNTAERKELCSRGAWNKAPGEELFQDERLKEVRKKLFFEDRGPAGQIEKVGPVREKFGFPGMASLQDAFGPNGSKSCIPHNLYGKCYYYLGTHDDWPIRDYFTESSPEVINHLKEYVNLEEGQDLFEAVLRTLYMTVGDGVIVQMQDILPYKPGMRMNFPGTPTGQWAWRFTSEEMKTISETTVKLFKKLVKVSERK